MKRKLIKQLIDWSEALQQKPILLTGARGVGKTYLAYDFAKAYYNEIIYINFEREPYLYDLFTVDIDSPIDDILKEYFHVNESSNSVILIFDEILACPDSNLVIKRILSLNNQYPIIAISSFITNRTFYDNLFMQMQLYPLDFEEFLTATGNEWYIEVIRWHFESNKALPNIVHQELLTFIEDFLQIGGMPIAVNEYSNTESRMNISEQHRILLNSYLSDAVHHNTEGESLKIIQAYSTIEKQLIKENRKFQYTLIRKGATLSLYADALQYIQDTFYGVRCNRIGDDTLNQLLIEPITVPDIKDFRLGFKLYMPDVGMLNSTIRTQYAVITEQMKKGILENYVAQSLLSNGYYLNFWESNSQSKIDFLIIKEQFIIPIEVKINENTRSKNISIFKTKCSQMIDSIKISTRNFEYANHVKYVPIYAVFCI